MGDRSEKGGTQPIRLDRELRPVHILHKVDPLDGKRALIDQGVEQTALIGGEQRPGFVAVDPHDADDAAAGPHRQEQAFRAWKRVRASARRAVVLPRPFRRRDIRVVENVLGRITGLDHDEAILRQQQNDPDLQHQRSLIRRCPEDVVEGSDPGQLAAECVKQFHRAHAVMRGHGLGSPARRKVRDHDRHDGEEHESGEVGRIGNREGIDRRKKEEIVTERRGDGGEQRRPKPIAYGYADHRGQKHEIDIFDSEQGLNELADAEGGGNRRERDRIGPQIKRCRAFRRAHRFLRDGIARKLIPRDDVDADIAGPPDQLMHH